MARKRVNGIRVDWDDEKSALLKATRGFSFEEILEIYEKRHWHGVKNDDPEQFQMIGWVQGRLITVIYESKRDEEGEYEFLRTYWPTTKAERKVYGIR